METLEECLASARAVRERAMREMCDSEEDEEDEMKDSSFKM